MILSCVRNQSEVCLVCAFWLAYHICHSESGLEISGCSWNIPSTSHVAIFRHDVISIHVDIKAMWLGLIDAQSHTVCGRSIQQQEAHVLRCCAAQVQFHPPICTVIMWHFTFEQLSRDNLPLNNWHVTLCIRSTVTCNTSYCSNFISKYNLQKKKKCHVHSHIMSLQTKQKELRQDQASETKLNACSVCTIGMCKTAS